MTADESEFAIAWSARTEFQVVIDLRRLAVFVSAENADIEIESRIFEVVRVPAIKRDLLLGRKNESDIIVTLVPIKMVRAALIKRDDVRTQSGFVFAFFLDRRNHALTRIGSLLARHILFDRAVHARSHVFDRHQDIELEIDAFLFLASCPSVKTVPEIIVLFVREFLERVSSDVMIGDDQTLGGHKRTAPAGTEPNARFLQMLKPLLARLEAVFVLQLLNGRRGVEPHSLIAKCAIAQTKEQERAEDRGKKFAHPAA